MADSNVYITGSEPDWAVQKALDGILAAVEKTQQVSKEQKKVIKDATSGGKVFDGEAIKKFRSGLKKTTADAFKQGRANKSLFDTTEDLNKEFKESSKSIKGLAIGVGSIASLLGFVYQQFMDTVAVFRELTDQGLSFKLGYMEVTKNLAKMGMSLDEFQAVMQRNATAMGKMGLDNFTNLISSIGEGFNKFGLTMAEGSEFASEFINQQRLLANYSIYTQKGLNDAVRSNIDRLTAYSKILNISRSELQAAQTEAASDDMVRQRFLAEGATLHDKAEEAYLNVISRFAATGGEDMARWLTDMMGYSTGQFSMSDAYQALADSAAGPVGQLLGKIADDLATKGTDVDSLEYMKEIGEESLRFIREEGYDIQKAMQGNDQNIAAIAKFAFGYDQAKKAGTLDPDSKVQATVEAAAKLNQNLKKLTSTFGLLGNVLVEKVLKLFGQEEGTEATMTGGMTAVANAAGDAADWLMRLAEGKIDWSDTFDTMLTKAGEFLWAGISAGFELVMTGIANIIAAAIDRLTYAVENWSIFGNNNEEKERKHQRRVSDVEGNIARAQIERNRSLGTLDAYYDEGVRDQMMANPATRQTYLDMEERLLVAIEEQNKIIKESNRRLGQLNDTAEANTG